MPAPIPQLDAGPSGSTIIRPTSGRVIVVEAISNVLKRSPNSASYSYTPVAGPFMDLGPQVEDVQAMLVFAGRENGFKMKARLAWSNDGFVWVGDDNAVLLTSEPGDGITDGQVIGAAFSNRLYFGRHLRLELGLADTAAGAKMAHLWLYLVIKFWSK